MLRHADHHHEQQQHGPALRVRGIRARPAPRRRGRPSHNLCCETEHMVVRHDFGAEGVAYVRSYLEANRGYGKLLGALLLSTCDIEPGVAWAFIPEKLPRERRSPLRDFEDGYLYFQSGRRVPWRDQFSDWLSEACDKQPDPWLVCVEHAMARPSDPWLEARPQEQAFFCGDSVFLYETAESPNVLGKNLLGGAIWDPAVGIITTMASIGKLANRQRLDEFALAKLAAQASAIVIGAWDDDGLIVWQLPAEFRSSFR